MKKLLLLALSGFICTFTFAQQKDWTSSRILQELKELKITGSVLYIAAHPDDENTRLISYLENHLQVRTAYLSLTRGDGGQNLVGNEKGAALGILRTQELLGARDIDGAEQFFTRAVDFGYSKTADETLEFWDKQKVLADVVWTIRKFRPDVIITRFPPDARAGHGHHTASAMLAEEAFDLANDPTAFPEQLKHVSLWQPKRLYWNCSAWWDRDIPNKAKDNPDYVTIDYGLYNPILGKSYSEIAAESRSMHKSQGFGSSKSRGSQLEYMVYTKGDRAENDDIMSGVDISWTRYNLSEVNTLIDQAIKEFNPEKPQAISDILWSIRKKITATKNTPNNYKLLRLNELILAVNGIWCEALANDYSAIPTDKISISALALRRLESNILYTSVKFGKNASAVLPESMSTNEMVVTQDSLVIDDKISNPYWLNNPFSTTYTVEKQELIGLPENKPAIQVHFTFAYKDQSLTISRPLQYRWSDRVKGELYRDFVVLPEATINANDKVYVFSNNQPKTLTFKVRANHTDFSGKLKFDIPNGWKVEPAETDIAITNKYEEKLITIQVFPPEGASDGYIKPFIESINGKKLTNSYIEIDYNHIQPQIMLPLAEARLVKLDINKKGSKVAYIIGAGDEVPAALEQMGYTVDMLDEDGLAASDLKQYDAVIAGIRAYNTQKYLPNYYDKLMEYVKQGGNYIVQYNTSSQFFSDGVGNKLVGPYPFKLSRDRVTEEDSEVKFIDPEHPILNSPNKITQADFNGWVQERGLYYANQWDEQYTPIISWNDKGETSKNGGLLVTNYGEGSFIYTGISFFRELPAGVPGAFRLLANIVSYGK